MALFSQILHQPLHTITYSLIIHTYPLLTNQILNYIDTLKIMLTLFFIITVLSPLNLQCIIPYFAITYAHPHTHSLILDIFHHSATPPQHHLNLQLILTKYPYHYHSSPTDTHMTLTHNTYPHLSSLPLSDN